MHDTGIPKSFIHDDLLHHGMLRVRFQRAARANGIVFVSGDMQTEKTQMYQ